MTNPWPASGLSRSAAVAEALSRVSTTVAVAHGLAASGRAIDLAGLDGAAGAMCAQVLDLPPTEGKALRPALAELAAKLSVLAHTLAAPKP